MNDWSEACRQALQIGAGLWIQSAFLLSVGLAAGWLLRRKGPLFEVASYQASLCAVLLSAFLAIALAGHISPIWRLTLPVHSVAQAASSLPQTVHYSAPTPHSPAMPSLRPSQSSLSVPNVRKVATRSVTAPWLTVYIGVVAAWFVISFAQLLWLLAGVISLVRIGRTPEVQKGERVSELLVELAGRSGVRVPRLIVHAQVRSPFVAGLFRPMIVLPAGMSELDEPVLRAILSHELGHVAAGDCVWAPLFRVVMALAWPQPLLRVLYCRWLSISEHACDARALTNGCSPQAYAECLVRLSEESRNFRAVQALALGMVPFPSLLGRRVQQILSWGGGKLDIMSRRVRCLLAGSAALAGCAAIFLVPANISARANVRHVVFHTTHSLPSSPEQQIRPLPELNHPVRIKQGATMNHVASRLLSTAAALAGGLVQVNLPPVAAQAPLPNSTHVTKSIHRPSPTISQIVVQATKSPAGNLLINMSCNNAPIRGALAQLFAAAGVGYSLANNVSGNVTLNVKSLPLSALLGILFKSSDQRLAYEFSDNVYSVKVAPNVPTGLSVPAVASSPPQSQDMPVTPAYAARANTYKVVIQNISASDLANRLNSNDVRQAGYYPPQARIVVLKADNALLISASPEDYQRLLGIIKTFDVIPPIAQIRVALVDAEETDLKKLGLSLQSIGGDPRSKENVALVQALQQGKLTLSMSPVMTTASGIDGSVTITYPLPTGPVRLNLHVTPTVMPDGTITTHLTWANDLDHTSFDYTTTVYSGETVLVGESPEEGSKLRLVFLEASILPSPNDLRASAQTMSTPDNAPAHN